MVRFGKSDNSVFVSPDVSPAISVFSHEDVEGGFWMRSRLASLVLLPSANFCIFGPDHHRLSLFSYDNLLAFGRLSLRWPNQDLLPIKLNHVHIAQDTGLCRASFEDFQQISIILCLWPIEPDDEKYYNH
jgi:hypothetical protein